MKTSELIGPALDWAVAKAEGVDTASFLNMHQCGHFHFSTDWSEGGPIIDRERISVVPLHGAMWGATTFPIHQIFKDDSEAYYQGVGPTPLIAAMRCFCVSKLGDEVELPKELK